LIRKPKILMLDDSTSALDVATESRLLQAIERYDCTMLIITQKIATALPYKQSNGMIVRCSSSHKKSLQPFVPIKSYCWMKGKCLPSDHMKNYYKQQSYIKKLSLPNLERSIYMFFKQLK